MDYLKRSWAQVNARFDGMTQSQRWLILVTLVFGLFLAGLFVYVFSAKDTVPITGFAMGRSDEALVRLQAAGIDARQQGTQIVVPVDEKADAIAMLVQDDLLSDNSSQAFDELIKNQSPWLNQQQNRVAYLAAKQKFLESVVRKMKGVKNAAVVLSLPEDTGFGSTFVRPSGSVSVTMRGSGNKVEQQLVEAVAGLISGSVAEMTPMDVVVIDANQGVQHTVDSADDMMAADAIALKRDEEREHREKIASRLRYIGSGLIVEVAVRTSEVAKRSATAWEYMKDQPLASEMVEDSTSKDTRQGGETGARPNTGMDIAGNRASGSEETVNKQHTEFLAQPLTKQETQVYSGHLLEEVNISIGVPRSYFVGIFRASNPDHEGPVDDTALGPIITRQLSMIESQVKPLMTSKAAGTVTVDMYPDESVFGAVTAGTSANGLAAVMQSDWVGPASMIGLAMLAVGIMLAMVRRATKPEQMPSVEELAGIPPSMNVDDELVGEAEEHEAAMAGVELGDDELRTRKVAEQISDMIKSNPDEASHLLKKWVHYDEY